MPITKPQLPPRKGYIEKIVDGKHVYVRDKSVVLPEDTENVWAELDAAYTEGVNTAYKNT